MTDRAIEDRHVLLVGGTSGIGLASADALLAAGVRTLTVAGRNPERGQAARNGLTERYPGATIHFVAMDAADTKAAQDGVAEAGRLMGRIDVLVSSASGAILPQLLKKTPIDTMPRDLWSVVGPVIAPARAVYPLMEAQGGGTVLCVASDACKVATPGEALIGAGMAAIAMYSRGMATEGKRDGIRVNCLTPSIVRGTDLYDRLFENDFASRLFGKAEKLAGLGVAEATDLAALVVFLAGPGADRLTGQTISVNGGISAV